MDYKEHKNLDDDTDFFNDGENHKDSHNLTPGMYSTTKDSKARSFMVNLKTKLSPRAKSKVSHKKIQNTEDDWGDMVSSPQDDSPPTKTSPDKVKSATEKTDMTASEKTKSMATNAAYKTKSAAQNLGDQTSEAAKTCWTEIKHKGSDVQGKLDEMAPRRRYARLGSESD